MSIITKISIGLLFLVGTVAHAQESLPIQSLIENLAESLPEDYDLSELTERFNDYQKHPIDLNKVNSEQLKSLLILSPVQISKLLEHIRKNGKLLDLLELQGIEGFDLTTINRLLPFVRLSSPNPLSNIEPNDLINKSKNDLVLRYGRLLQTQKGFRDLTGSRYLGTPDKLMLRYRYNYSDRLSAALVAEKDAGEPFFNGKSGLDHLSGNINISDLKCFKKIVIGDYSLQFGQGLSMSSGFALGKGADVTSVTAKDMGLNPYAASNESSFFRGIASITNVNKYLDLTSFVSFRKLDASLKLQEEKNYTLQNINTSGLHRTVTELKNKKSLEQQMYGAALQYIKKDFRLGTLTYYMHYDRNFITGEQRYNEFGFVGKNLVNSSIYYSFTWNNFFVFGEVAHSAGSGWAFINGIMGTVSAQVSCVLVHRSYQKNYHSFYGNGLSEGSEINNEKGWYAGLNYTPNKHWLLSVYGDRFSFPWARYRIDTASSGYEGLAQICFTPDKKNRFSLRYKRELKAQNPDAGTESLDLQNVVKESFRADANWPLNKKLNFQQRLEISHYQKDAKKEWGYLIYSDLNYKPTSSKISGNMRVACFYTPSYNSRIYAYEDDVLYASGFEIYYGQGIRSFLNLRYRLMPALDFFFRYAISFYPGQERMGSGLEEIEGNRKSDIKVQLKYQF